MQSIDGQQTQGFFDVDTVSGITRNALVKKLNMQSGAEWKYDPHMSLQDAVSQDGMGDVLVLEIEPTD